jgi:hypothetical protein
VSAANTIKPIGQLLHRQPSAAIVTFDERSLNMMLGSYTGRTVVAKIIKPTWYFLSLRERELLVSMGGTEGATSARERFSSADPPRNNPYASPGTQGETNAHNGQ